MIDGHKCGPSGLQVATSQQLDHLNKINKKTEERKIEIFLRERFVLYEQT